MKIITLLLLALLVAPPFTSALSITDGASSINSEAAGVDSDTSDTTQASPPISGKSSKKRVCYTQWVTDDGKYWYKKDIYTDDRKKSSLEGSHCRSFVSRYRAIMQWNAAPMKFPTQPLEHNWWLKP